MEIPVRLCPICRTKPVKMVFKFPDKKRPEEYSYICCDLNPGHSKTIELAQKSWNHLAREKYDEMEKQKEA